MYATALSLLVTAATAAGSTQPAATTQTAAASEPVARIGSFTLTRDLFEALWTALPPSVRATYESRGGKPAYLRDYVQQKVTAVRAAELGYRARPALQAALENAENAILGRAYVDEEVTRKIVSEDAMRAYYEQYKDGFVIPERLRARHIVVTPHKERLLKNTSGDDAASDDAAQAKIRRLVEELAAGADFAELARSQSEDLSATQGGELEEFSRGRMARAIDDAAFALEAGQVSGVVQTPYGYHLIKVEEKFPERQQSFAEVKDRIAMAVAQDKRAEFKPRLDELTAVLEKELEVTILAPDLAAAPETPPAETAEP